MTLKRNTLLVIISITHVSFFVIWYSMEVYKFKNPHKVIKVETTVYDPRDLLSGQYIRLRYNFNRIDTWDRLTQKRNALTWAKDYNLKCGKSGFVILSQKINTNLYEATRIICSNNIDNLAQNEVAMRIKSSKYGILNFGIDRFYVPEGTLEPSRREILTVELGLTKAGIPSIRQVYLKGKPLS